MDQQILLNTIMLGLQSFLSNTGQEMAKNFGKDCYNKIKSYFKECNEKEIVHRFEVEPTGVEAVKEFRNLLIQTMSARPEFHKEITSKIHVSPANTFILNQVCTAMVKIQNELEIHYDWLTKTTGERNGKLEMDIDMLELQLTQLETKLFKIVGKSYLVE